MDPELLKQRAEFKSRAANLPTVQQRPKSPRGAELLHMFDPPTEAEIRAADAEPSASENTE